MASVPTVRARPMILSDRTGELVIIAGNMRYRAAEKLGLKKVPTFLISGLTPFSGQ